MMFDPLMDRASDPMIDDNDILALDASFGTCAESEFRRRAHTDTILSTPDRKRKRNEEGFEQQDQEGGESMAIDESSVVYQYDDDERRDDISLANPKPASVSIVPQPQLHEHRGRAQDDMSISVPPSLVLEESFRAQRHPRSQSMQHVRSQSMQQHSSAPAPAMRHQRSQSMSHMRSMSMPSLVEESVYEDTVLCGDQIVHARYRNSHEPRPFSGGPPSPELLSGRKKKHQAPQSYDSGYGNTTQYQGGPVRKAMNEFRSLENPSCEEYLEKKFRKQNVVLEEIRSKMPKPPQHMFKKDPKLQRSSGYLT